MAAKTDTILLNVAIAGNPNAGKTTVFNALSGARQKTANWPGVTVERKEGTAKLGELSAHVVDLPGAYGLSPGGLDEAIARDYLLGGELDVVVDVVDSTVLERSLAFAVELLELGRPTVIALNMYDEVQQSGASIDADGLGQLLGARCVLTSANRGRGIEELKSAIVRSRSKPRSPLKIDYGTDVEAEIERLQPLVERLDVFPSEYSRWATVRLLERDVGVETKIAAHPNGKSVLDELKLSLERVLARTGDEADTLIAERRFGVAVGAVRECTIRPSVDRLRATDRIDAVLLSKVLGYPTFAVVMWLLFQATFLVGNIGGEAIEAAVAGLSGLVSSVMGAGLLRSMLVDGVIGGVGGVVVFLPHILVLFLGISLLEDTGYMARAAFLMDRLMHAVGLHGKSFIPLLLGFGCNVPAIMAARTLESRRDRLITILINPFMSCSARLPVYILVAGAFFGSAAGNVIFVLYALGIVVAIGVGRLLASFVFGGRSAPFVMELPPYRTPTLRGTLLHMWDRAWVYLRKMGTLVLAFSIVVWFFSTFPRSGDGAETATAQEQTYLGRFGHAIAPVMEPLGFGWKETVALGTGVVAKEIVVSTMAVLYAGGDEEALPDELLVSGLTPLSAFAFLVFVLLYTPCLVTVVAVKREAGGWRWAALSVFGQMLIAWTFAFTVVQGGRLMGLGP